MVTSSLRVPKQGHTPRECEDAAHVVAVPDGSVLAAVADGASESLLAGEWADLLTRTVTDAARDDDRVLRDADRFAAALVRAGQAWGGWLAEYVAKREAEDRPIAWYEQPKLDRGPHATVLAARFDADPSGVTRWEVAALGDSCLFHTRDDELLRAFPIESAAAFDNTPGLVNAFNRDQELLARHVRAVSGTASGGDGFFLCTDALAAWFLGAAQRGERPWRALAEFTRTGDLDGFTVWLAHARAEGLMRNDDVTVVHVDLG
ncbi:protein phosphatase 2C domain-containing protein [Saccharothrix sp. 6-C]|uniref:Protein phosphatase 2C-like protein n=1 Tax=Saccharothrix texasensis TaxID=103734 RepID=A0A3N1GZG0_9PSEU|nr:MULTISPECIES: protein phosphatase 2C domain-containing protein [Saccharothrix]QQQ80042.1 protein phosphatase 2C domain-containing protein [Saccharothrix sp. 6-C]ROP35638.1 protein phosphatase 2C-like protein [Saccharothrix texasensis]